MFVRSESNISTASYGGVNIENVPIQLPHLLTGWNVRPSVFPGTV